MMIPHTHQTWEQGKFAISTDPSKLQVDRIHKFLTTSYWATGIPIETVKRSIEHSLNFGLYRRGQIDPDQIGFARVVTDYSTFAYLGDVYVETAWRGLGLSKWLMTCITSHPKLQGLRRFCLGTRDAHSLYQQFGFQVVKQPENWMEIKIANLYQRGSAR